MKTRLLIIIGIVLIVLGIDGLLFVSSNIHDHCIFNIEVGHNVYADSYIPCEIASFVIPISGTLFVIGMGVLIFSLVIFWRNRKCQNQYV